MMKDAPREKPPPAPAEALYATGAAERFERLAATGLEVLRSDAEIDALVELLIGERDTPVLVVSQSEETLRPVLPAEALRAIVGPLACLYYVPGERLLRRLSASLGRGLAVHRGAVRVFWPELDSDSDPGDHPLVAILPGEAEEQALEEFARQFDLSRPHVRREVKLIEDARSVLQDAVDVARGDLRTAAERLRDAHIERHEAVVRAERAESAETGKE